jgi:DNA-binding XRE family transcriptional regulator
MSSPFSISPIGKFRAEFQLTRQRLAVLLKTNISTIYRWERDNTIPTLKLQGQLDKLRQLFSANPDWRDYDDVELRAALYPPRPPLLTPERAAKLRRVDELKAAAAKAHNAGRVVPAAIVRELQDLQDELGLVPLPLAEEVR